MNSQQVSEGVPYSNKTILIAPTISNAP